jgi:uncharacterized protein GlcG (DUF336 family)
MVQRRYWVVLGVALFCQTVLAAPSEAQDCGSAAVSNALRQALRDAATGTGISPALIGPGGGVGGLFNGTRMWAAAVLRDGTLCSAATSTDDPTQVWPGSQAIAKAKAFTANAFSLDSLPLSTANLYTLTQPGHSLFGLNNSNPFNAALLAPPTTPGVGGGQVVGGIITFGGGVPIYLGGSIIGGLGVSGDTACTDHEIAKRVRDRLGLNPPGGPLADDIVYPPPASVFAHPVCNNTFKNGVLIGNETP